MTIQVKLNMIDNGLDFLLKSLDTIDDNDENLKYSIINLHAGIQLLLKELLFQEHWSLIFQKIEQAKKERLISGDFVSVNYETLIQRLKNIAEIQLDDRLIEELELLRKDRNKIEHYHFVVTPDILKSRIVNILTYFIPFLKAEMVEEGLVDSNDESYTQIIEHLNEFEDYINERMLLLKERLGQIDIILKCPVCYREAVEFNDETDVFCHFCNENISSFKERYIENFVDTYSYVKDGGENPLHECPDCGMDTFICLDGYQYICLTCGIKPTQDVITTCDGPRCNGEIVYREEDGASFCEYCMDYFKNA
ncbi:hypothetical protein GCM10012290_07700 [Halolactibacillus alkaliphilus]|uniref:Uncharacterized protein n=1 Tax=Halolactibacillus alkaliphilus TaxID=442899 RepID=A0A511X561_9BACI|nr:hypothetical protein [Halolactibacillus alkaliphilus]GEN58073.1 hypothetical protein HAL01_25370 [Halolactibacillus alkaliphilus]GGN67337.1 hypothetical protein GCM10012290_07700 [Halolactibacillus alkaliphilus]SFP12658.1 hypothetical protein SAMN05720591_1554 [Halolactibacillus alkaliphilus]